jgi:hypothetical protein
MLSFSDAQNEQIQIIDRFLATLDPEYVEKLFDQLRIMGVLKEGAAGDYRGSSYELLSQLAFHIQDQDSIIEQLKVDVQTLKSDMTSVAKMIQSLIPKDPQEVASPEGAIFYKHGIYYT